MTIKMVANQLFFNFNMSHPEFLQGKGIRI